jgi:long-chain acyl-CoA synthetase
LESYGDLPVSVRCEHETALEMFKHAVHAVSRRPLLYYFERPISAIEVDQLSNALAAGFAAGGIGRGDRVGVYLQNVPQFVIAVVAAWKVGAAVVPCNPMLKQRELEFILRESEPKALIAHSDIYEAHARNAAEAAEVGMLITTADDLERVAEVPAGTVDFVDVLETWEGSRRTAI